MLQIMFLVCRWKALDEERDREHIMFLVYRWRALDEERDRKRCMGFGSMAFWTCSAKSSIIILNDYFTKFLVKLN
jgi:hypothetical protein